jgi:hypothetical protein
MKRSGSFYHYPYVGRPAVDGPKRFPHFGASVTDQQSEMDKQTSGPQEQSAKTPADSRRSGVSAEAIALGLEFLFSRHRQAAWSLCDTACEASPWVTAYVLARLGEIPSHHLSYQQRQKIEESLDWLMQVRTPQGGWAFGRPSSSRPGSPDVADSTAWAVTALRQYGRPVPQEALDLIQRCRRPDGSFVMHPISGNNASGPGAADITAIAARALSAIDAPSSEFLIGRLRTDIETSHGCISSAFFVSSTLMDWEPCMAPWFVVNAVRQLVAQQEAEGAWEQALLLRCRMRLRLQSAWPLAAGLRRLQQPDGSWPGSARLTTFQAVSGDDSTLHPDEHFDEEGILATATALSALAIGDLQPGLYFGSDLPFRRL